MSRARSAPWRAVVVAAGLTLLGGMVAAACTSAAHSDGSAVASGVTGSAPSNPAHGSASTGTHSSPSTHSSSVTHSTSGTQSSSSGYLQSLQNTTAAASNLTFKATYKASAGRSTLTYSQMGTRSAFSDGTSTYYSDAGFNTECDMNNGGPTCYTNRQPLSGVLSLISPIDVLAALQELDASGTQGVIHNTQRNGVQCLTYTLQGQAVKYCIRPTGIVSLLSTPDGSFRLTAYTTTVTEGDVTPP